MSRDRTITWLARLGSAPLPRRMATMLSDQDALSKAVQPPYKKK